MMTQSRRSPRYRVTTCDDGRVVVTSSDPDVIAALEGLLSAASSVTRTYWAPRQPGGVYEEHGHRIGTTGRQVCERLCHSGRVLRADRDTLPRVIRRELRRALAPRTGR